MPLNWIEISENIDKTGPDDGKTVSESVLARTSTVIIEKKNQPGMPEEIFAVTSVVYGL